MITDADRATDLARALLGEVATEEIVGALREAFAAVRADERRRVLREIADKVQIRRARPAGWEESTWA